MQPEIVALQREVAGLRRAVRGQRGRQRRATIVAAVALLVAALAPVSALATNPFRDLNPGSVHNGNIAAIHNAGITTGCVPNEAYCPDGLVTREEMASFLARTAGLGGNPPVVNARTAQTAQTATSATSAANAQQLNGQPASAYQLAGQPVASATNAQNAANAAALNGFAANALARTNLGASGPGVGLGTSPTILASTGVQVPGPGFLLVSGAAVFYATASPTNALASVRLRDVQGGLSSFPLYAVIGTTSGAAFEQSMSPVWEFQVLSPGSRTVVLEALIDPASFGGVAAANAAITVLYVPFGPGGVQASEADPSLPAESWPAHRTFAP